MNEGARDWAAVRRRFEAAEQALSRGAEPAREEIERIYRKRAEELAWPLAQTGDVQTESILVFRAGPGREHSARLGIPLTRIAEVIPHPKIARVPGAPSDSRG